MGKDKFKPNADYQTMLKYLREHSPYKPEPFGFDVRGYHRYLIEHDLVGKDVPEEIMRQFLLDDEGNQKDVKRGDNQDLAE